MNTNKHSRSTDNEEEDDFFVETAIFEHITASFPESSALGVQRATAHTIAKGFEKLQEVTVSCISPALIMTIELIRLGFFLVGGCFVRLCSNGVVNVFP